MITKLRTQLGRSLLASGAVFQFNRNKIIMLTHRKASETTAKNEEEIKA